MPVTASEHAALLAALELARRGPAHGPNPRVGCVLLADDGVQLAAGFHRGAGTPHAEADALANARAAGHDTRGTTAVVTLEPCDHTGRTGPCSQALVAAGVRRVVFAVADPSAAAAGGAARLRAAGIDVVGPLSGETGTAAEELVRPWLTAVRHARPFVTLKIAATLDGRIAAADGSSRWITSAESRAHAHRLRSEVDAIAVGTGTALTDDPALTARTPRGDLAGHQPLRVVVGRRDLPEGARVRGPGGELLAVRTHDPVEVLAELHAREVRHVLVEGGPTLAGAFLRARLVDEVHAYVAPVLLGAGRAAVGDLGATSIGEALRLEPREVLRLGPDVLLVAAPPGATDPRGTGTSAAGPRTTSLRATDPSTSDPSTTNPSTKEP